MQKLVANVHVYYQGLKSCLGYEIDFVDGLFSCASRENSLEDIHFIVKDDYVVVVEDYEIQSYLASPDKVRLHGEKIVNCQVDFYF